MKTLKTVNTKKTMKHNEKNEETIGNDKKTLVFYRFIYFCLGFHAFPCVHVFLAS